MGVRVVADQRIGLLDHPSRDCGVEVERGDERDGGTDRFPDRGEELSLAVRRVLQHHRAVEGEEHAVEAACRGEPLEDGVLHVVEGRARHWPRRHGVRRDGRDHLDPRRPQDVQEPAHLGPGAAEPGEDLVPVKELGGSEMLEVSPLADEGVRLLHELPDRDPHRGHLNSPQTSKSGVRP